MELYFWLGVLLAVLLTQQRMRPGNKWRLAGHMLGLVLAAGLLHAGMNQGLINKAEAIAAQGFAPPSLPAKLGEAYTDNFNDALPILLGLLALIELCAWLGRHWHKASGKPAAAALTPNQMFCGAAGPRAFLHPALWRSLPWRGRCLLGAVLLSGVLIVGARVLDTLPYLVILFVWNAIWIIPLALLIFFALLITVLLDARKAKLAKQRKAGTGAAP